MYEEGPVDRIKFSESKLLGALSIAVGVFGTITAVFTRNYNEPIFFFVPLSLLVIILAMLASIVTFFISEYSEMMIYKDRLVCKSFPFKKHYIDFSEVQNINTVENKRFQGNRLEFEMINLDDVSINLSYVTKEKSEEITYAVLSAWRSHKGYVKKTRWSSPGRWDESL